MDLIRKIPKKFTKKFGSKVINKQYFRRKTGLKSDSFCIAERLAQYCGNLFGKGLIRTCPLYGNILFYAFYGC